MMVWAQVHVGYSMPIPAINPLYQYGYERKYAYSYTFFVELITHISLCLANRVTGKLDLVSGPVRVISAAERVFKLSDKYFDPQGTGLSS